MHELLASNASQGSEAWPTPEGAQQSLQGARGNVEEERIPHFRNLYSLGCVASFFCIFFSPIEKKAVKSAQCNN